MSRTIYIKKIFEWVCDNELVVIIVLVCVILMLIAYFWMSLTMKFVDRRSNTKKFSENNNKLEVLAHSFKSLSDNVDILKQKSDISQIPYESLSSVYDLEISIGKIKDEYLINFLYSKLLEIIKITKYAILTHSLIIDGKSASSELVFTTLDHYRNKIVLSCINNLGAEFSKINSRANENIFSESKSVLVTILEDKKKNDKVKRIIEASKTMLSKTMRATIYAHDKFYKIKNNGTDCDFNVFDNFIKEGKLHEATINLLGCEYEKESVLLLIGRVTNFETDIIQGLIEGEKEKIMYNKLSSDAMDLKTKIQNKIKNS